MIKLLRLNLENFFSHKESRIDFSNKQGLILIEGINSDGRYDSNGSGKSTILEGIVYALSGNTLRNVGVNDMVNRNVGKNTCSSLSLDVNGSEYRIERYRKDTLKGDKLELWDVGEDVSGEISKRLNKDTQILLDGIIDIPYKVLVNTILLGEGLSSRFTQLSDPEKKSLIESTLNLSYDLNKSRDSANEKLKSLKLKLATLEGEISTLENLQSVDIEMIEDSIYDNNECIKVYEETITSIKSESEVLSAEIESINPKLQLINDTLNKVNNYHSQYVSLMQSNEHYQGERDRVLNEEVPVCSLCRQLLASQESKQSVIDSYQEKINENLINMKSIEEELAKLPDLQTLQFKYSELSKEYQEKSSHYRDLLSDYNSYNVKLAETRKDIESLKATLQDASDCHAQLEEKIISKKKYLEEIKDYEYFYKLYSPTGIMTIILEEAISYINSRMKVYTEILLDKSYFLTLEKGKISLKDESGASYQSLSNGEKRRLDLCIQFSLHDYTQIYCGSGIDTLFLDEVLDTLDATGVNNIIEVLRLKMDYCKLARILVISHNSSLKSYFDEVITVRKDSEGNSSIIE